MGWPPRVRQVRVRVRVRGEPEAVGCLRAVDAVDKDLVPLTLPVDGNRIELSLRRGWKASPGDHDVLSLRAGWTTPGGGFGEAGFDSIGLEAPVPPDGEPWSVRLLDSPSLRFEQLQASARWRARYFGSRGKPAVSDGTAELRRAHANLEGDVLLPPESRAPSPRTSPGLRSVRTTSSGSRSPVARHESRRAGGSFVAGRVTWSTSSPIGGDRLFAIEGIPRLGNGTPARRRRHGLVRARTSGGGRISRSSPSGRAYDAEAPLLLDLAPTGPRVFRGRRTDDPANVQLLTMCVGGLIERAIREYVTDASGGADASGARRCGSSSARRLRRRGGACSSRPVACAEIALTAGWCRHDDPLFDDRTPTQADAYLVTRGPSACG
jgi:hypothetical protein